MKWSLRRLERCPKCGQLFGGPRYDATSDLLRYECASCGFATAQVPLDGRPA